MPKIVAREQVLGLDTIEINRRACRCPSSSPSLLTGSILGLDAVEINPFLLPHWNTTYPSPIEGPPLKREGGVGSPSTMTATTY